MKYGETKYEIVRATKPKRYQIWASYSETLEDGRQSITSTIQAVFKNEELATVYMINKMYEGRR